MMSDSNSRLVYSTETGRIDEPKAAPVRLKGNVWGRFHVKTSVLKGKRCACIPGVVQDVSEGKKGRGKGKKRGGGGGVEKGGL
ncbi:stress response translation initiation inhibitor YciH, partial [Escherichia coli]|nr:stress response translation initiation inhibitor YciH [Escherichia coli]